MPISAHRDWIDLHRSNFIFFSLAVCNIAYIHVFGDRRFTVVSLVPVFGKEAPFYWVWKRESVSKVACDIWRQYVTSSVQYSINCIYMFHALWVFCEDVNSIQCMCCVNKMMHMLTCKQSVFGTGLQMEVGL